MQVYLHRQRQNTITCWIIRRACIVFEFVLEYSKAFFFLGIIYVCVCKFNYCTQVWSYNSHYFDEFVRNYIPDIYDVILYPTKRLFRGETVDHLLPAGLCVENIIYILYGLPMVTYYVYLIIWKPFANDSRIYFTNHEIFKIYICGCTYIDYTYIINILICYFYLKRFYSRTS